MIALLRAPARAPHARNQADRVVDSHGVDGLLDMSELTGAHGGTELLNRIRAAPIEHLAFDAWRRIADAQPNEKAIELRLRKWVGAVELLWVLRRHYEERLFEHVGLAVDRHLAFIHCLEESALCLGRRSVDLIGKQHLREDRAGPKLEGALGLIENVAAKNVGRHQIRSALKAAERHAHRGCESSGQGGLAHTWNVFEQEMPACQERDDRQLDDFFFAPDYPRDVLNETLG